MAVVKQVVEDRQQLEIHSARKDIDLTAHPCPLFRDHGSLRMLVPTGHQDRHVTSTQVEVPSLFIRFTQVVSGKSR